MKRPDPRSAQRREIPSHTEGLAQIVGQRTRVCPAGNLAAKLQPRGPPGRQIERIDARGAQRNRRVLARAGIFVEPPAFVPDRRINRRTLLDPAGQGPHRLARLVFRGPRPGRRIARRDQAFGVHRRRNGAQNDLPLVGLVQAVQKIQQPRRRAQRNRQQPRGHRIERSRVPDAAKPVEPPQAYDRVVGGDAAGLVEEKRGSARPDGR
ncbi:MAG: hypothetical protein BWZ10_02887 [candidate division BRC1 bacterium ADurb.BinA364]|nr:MAG: hypothetical protein BWZ10_02887 [candidate division BRC1 bacterium ADurb.BinA364]